MNHKNARIGKLWTSGLRDLSQIARKIGLPDTPASRERVRSGLEWLTAAGELQPPFPSGLGDSATSVVE